MGKSAKLKCSDFSTRGNSEIKMRQKIMFCYSISLHHQHCINDWMNCRKISS